MCSDVLGNVCASNSRSGMARFILTPAPGVWGSGFTTSFAVDSEFGFNYSEQREVLGRVWREGGLCNAAPTDADRVTNIKWIS